MRPSSFHRSSWRGHMQHHGTGARTRMNWRQKPSQETFENDPRVPCVGARGQQHGPTPSMLDEDVPGVSCWRGSRVPVRTRSLPYTPRGQRTGSRAGSITSAFTASSLLACLRLCVCYFLCLFVALCVSMSFYLDICRSSSVMSSCLRLCICYFLCLFVAWGCLCVYVLLS